jgi:three-Cys-motif partner protein
MVARRKDHGDYWTQGKLRTLEMYHPQFLERIAGRFTGTRRKKTIYIDGCAGSGHVERWNPEKAPKRGGFFDSPPNTSEGSALRALRADPGYDEYVFVEIKRQRAERLRAAVREALEDMPEKRGHVKLRCGDVNQHVRRLCAAKDWNHWRGVVFLDPPGTQVEWETVEAVGDTGALDLWYLFPLGQAVNRFLARRAVKLEDWHRRELTKVFGTDAWFEAFYRAHQRTQFDLQNGGTKQVTVVTRHAEIEEVMRYFVDRLKTVFPHVVDWPLRLCNRTNVQMYGLSFASHSRKRMEIAREIMRRPGARWGL